MSEANGFVSSVDAAWFKLGEMLNLPSAKRQTAPIVEAKGTTIELPGHRRATFRLESMKSEYDFNDRSSKYTANLEIGNAEVRPTRRETAGPRFSTCWTALCWKVNNYVVVFCLVDTLPGNGPAA
jgi:hypothetical protein